MVIMHRHDGPAFHPDLLTPRLTQDGIDLHFTQQKTPVVVYPEIVSGNPLAAPCVVRYVLNYPGLLGGASTYPPDELVYAFSKELANYCGRPEQVLHMPVIDTTVFKQSGSLKRKGICFYASKFQSVHGQKPFDLPPGAVEITRDKRNSQSPQEIAKLFNGSEAFYCYENSALAIEAVLCGCPAVFMPSPFLKRPIAVQELGWEGFAWGTNAAELQRARETVQRGSENYQKTIVMFFNQLNNFIKKTQKRAAVLPCRTKLNFQEYDITYGEVRDRIRNKQAWTMVDRFNLLWDAAVAK